MTPTTTREHRYRRAREQAGLTMGQASRLLGVGLVWLSDVELSKVPPTEDEQRRMADVYGCSVEWLRGDHVEPPADLVQALRDADVTFTERDEILGLVASIQGLPPRGTAAERMERIDRLRRAPRACPAPRASSAEQDAEIPVREKAAYVRSQRQTRKHHCHWPGCDKQVPPAMWGCKAHWYKLPIALRNRIWRAYVPGQEATMTPSEEYLQVADDVQRWIRDNVTTKGPTT